MPITYRGSALRLKWHMLRRRADDMPFDRDNFAEALAVGAVQEVDLRLLADGAFAILHEPLLERETSGTGPARSVDTTQFIRLRQRASDGSLGEHPPLLLADLIAPLAGAPPGANLQLDMKESGAQVDDEMVARFVATVAPVARKLTLSGTDASLVRRIGSHLPHMRIGYDPMRQWAGKPDRASLDRFIADALAAMPGMAIAYLDRRLVSACAAIGLDPVAPFHAAGIEVDVWTIDAGMKDTATDLKAALDLAADQITTNSPLALAAEIEALSALVRFNQNGRIRGTSGNVDFIPRGR